MQNDGKLETWPFRGPFFINKKASRNQILHNNHKHGSRIKYFKIIFTHQYQVSPRPYLYGINLKWNKSDVLSHTNTSILWTIKMTSITLSIHINNTSYTFFLPEYSIKIITPFHTTFKFKVYPHKFTISSDVFCAT